MKVNHHLVFSEDRKPEFCEYLRKNSIPYQNTGHVMTLDISNSDPHWHEIQNLVNAYSIVCTSETTFSKKELSNAEWLRVRSTWRNGYPQPETAFGYRGITYSEKAYCSACGGGLHQVAPFRIKAAPRWGNRHFMMLNWVFDELFVDDSARALLTNFAFSGFHFMEVHNKKGTDEVPGVHQLVVDAISDQGFIEGQPNVRNILTCPACGRKKYHPTGIGMHSFQWKALQNMPDICKTTELFGWGNGADRLILMRQHVYQALIENKLDRTLEFSPIDLK